MHILPPRHVDFSKLKLISTPKSPRQLFTLDENQFLIHSKASPELMFPFESEEMTEIIKDHHRKIADTEVTTLRPIICRDHERLGAQEFEVRVYLQRGDTIVIHSHHGVMIL